MGWPYRFLLDLTPDEAVERRQLLDKYGIIAQLSAVVVIIAVVLYQWIFNRRHTLTVPRQQQQAYAPVPADAPATEGAAAVDGAGPQRGQELEMQSPAHFADALNDDEEAVAEDEREGLMAPNQEHQSRDGPQSPAAAVAGAPARMDEKDDMARKTRLGAWLDTPLRKGWKETRRQAIAIGIWAVWIVSLVFRETGEDYLHVTKRWAHLAAALLPFHYLLGTSSRLSPLPLLFRTAPSHLYNPYHRFHALLILFLLANHAGWYLNFYLWAGKLPGRLLDLDVFLGLTMATMFLVMALLARQAIRYDPKRRPWFVNSHLGAAFLIPCLLFFHAPPARWYAVEMLLVYAGVGYERYMRRREGRSGKRARRTPGVVAATGVRDKKDL